MAPSENVSLFYWTRCTYRLVPSNRPRRLGFSRPFPPEKKTHTVFYVVSYEKNVMDNVLKAVNLIAISLYNWHQLGSEICCL